MKQNSILFLLVFLFSCSPAKKENEILATNALKTILPKQDTAIQIDHFIFIDSTEIYYFDKIQTSLNDIVKKLIMLKKDKNNLTIQLEVNSNVKMDKFIEIMKVCTKENIELRLKSK